MLLFLLFVKDPPLYTRIIVDITELLLGIGTTLLGLFGKDTWLWRSRLTTTIIGILVTIAAIVFVIYRFITYHTW
jgi:hypothetical protein